MLDKRRWLPCWQRVELVEKCLSGGMTRREAAAWRRVSVATVQYWVERYRGARCSEEVHDRVCEARERTGWGPRLIAQSSGWRTPPSLAACLGEDSRASQKDRESRCDGLSGLALEICCRWTSSASRVSHGRGMASPATATAPARRRAHGWAGSSRHSIIDDHSRLAYTELLADEQAATVTAFLARALEFFDGHGITARWLQTDNHFSYSRNRGLRDLLTRHGIHHVGATLGSVRWTMNGVRLRAARFPERRRNPAHQMSDVTPTARPHGKRVLATY